MKKPKVGDIVYSLNVGNAARSRKKELTEFVVQKVGRKYFYAGKEGCPKWMMYKYDLESWHEVNNYSATSKLYKSKQEYLEQGEMQEICASIAKIFDWGKNHRHLNLETLRKIRELMGG